MTRRYDELVLVRAVALSSMLATAVTALTLVSRHAVGLAVATAYVLFLSPAVALALTWASERTATGA